MPPTMLSYPVLTELMINGGTVGQSGRVSKFGDLGFEYQPHSLINCVTLSKLFVFLAPQFSTYTMGDYSGTYVIECFEK